MFFRILFTPSIWIRNGKTSFFWDAQLKEAMKKHKFVLKDGYAIASLGELDIWIANHPHASFTPAFADLFPKRSTVLEAHDKLIKDIANG